MNLIQNWWQQHKNLFWKNLYFSYMPVLFRSWEITVIKCPFYTYMTKTLLPYMTKNIPAISHQHGLKDKHLTHTALHNICHEITTCFNNPRPPQRIVAVTLDMSKVFDTVNIYKLTLTNIPIIIIKFKAIYIKGQTCTQYNGTLSKLKRINTGVPQGGVLSPTLFNIYTSDIPLPPKDVQITTYADDTTITSSYTKHRTLNLSHTQMTLITPLTVVNYQQNTTPLVSGKSL